MANAQFKTFDYKFTSKLIHYDYVQRLCKYSDCINNSSAYGTARFCHGIN